MSKWRIALTVLVAALLIASGIIVVQLTRANRAGPPAGPAGGGIIIAPSATPATGSPSAVAVSASPGQTLTTDAQRVALPALAYVSALHGIDYSLGYPGWKSSSFDNILTGDLLAEQQQRSAAVASGPATAGDQATWDLLVANRTITTTVIEKWSVVRQEGSWLVQINWHLLTSQTGVKIRSGGMFTVITVVQVQGAFLASSDAMPQGS